jgi:hypothetical protein
MAAVWRFDDGARLAPAATRVTIRPDLLRL